ncbi:MAG: GTP cyclohydrolase I, partial [Pyrinomonadaceae bacterium]
MAKKIKKKIDLKKIADGVRLMLEGMGEDPERDGLKKTPERVADFYAELTEGMWIDPKEYIVPLPGDSHDEMVIVKDISFSSVCEHHLAPFIGKCHVAYIPKGG